MHGERGRSAAGRSATSRLLSPRHLNRGLTNDHPTPRAARAVLASTPARAVRRQSRLVGAGGWETKKPPGSCVPDGWASNPGRDYFLLPSAILPNSAMILSTWAELSSPFLNAKLAFVSFFR